MRDGIGNFHTPRPGDVVLDVGAHAGLFSVPLLRQPSGCRVVALEPSENYQYLRENLKDAPADRFEAHRLALGGTPGWAGMALATHRPVDARTQAAPAEAEGAVEVITLGRLLELARCDRAALLQMDVEGAENAVFASAPDAVLDRVDRLCLEVHDNRVPHTLDLPRRRLGPAHDVRVVPDEGRHALLFAKHRAVAS